MIVKLNKLKFFIEKDSSYPFTLQFFVELAAITVYKQILNSQSQISVKFTHRTFWS